MAAKILSAAQIAADFRDELRSLETGSVNQMLGRWMQVEQVLIAEAEDYAARFPPGTTLSPGQILRQDRYIRLQKQVEAALADLQPGVLQQWDADTHQAIELGQSQAQQILSSLDVGDSFNTLPEAAVENIVALTRAGQPLEELFQPTYGAATDGIMRELIQGVALGRGPRDIARRMMQDGMTDGLNHLLLTTRDQYNRAHRNASLESYKASGVVTGYVRRCARQAGRTCIACIALDGTFYHLEEGFEGHPQDRCVLIPAVKDVDLQPLSDGKAWFKNLSEEEQIASMGRERWEMWKNGELSWKNMVQRKTHPVWGTSVTAKPMSKIKANPPKTKAQKKATKAAKKKEAEAIAKQAAAKKLLAEKEAEIAALKAEEAAKKAAEEAEKKAAEEAEAAAKVKAEEALAAQKAFAAKNAAKAAKKKANKLAKKEALKATQAAEAQKAKEEEDAAQKKKEEEEAAEAEEIEKQFAAKDAETALAAKKAAKVAKKKANKLAKKQAALAASATPADLTAEQAAAIEELAADFDGDDDDDGTDFANKTAAAWASEAKAAKFEVAAAYGKQASPDAITKAQKKYVNAHAAKVANIDYGDELELSDSFNQAKDETFQAAEAYLKDPTEEKYTAWVHAKMDVDEMVYEYELEHDLEGYATTGTKAKAKKVAKKVEDAQTVSDDAFAKFMANEKAAKKAEEAAQTQVPASAPLPAIDTEGLPPHKKEFALAQDYYHKYNIDEAEHTVATLKAKVEARQAVAEFTTWPKPPGVPKKKAKWTEPEDQFNAEAHDLWTKAEQEKLTFLNHPGKVAYYNWQQEQWRLKEAVTLAEKNGTTPKVEYKKTKKQYAPFHIATFKDLPDTPAQIAAKKAAKEAVEKAEAEEKAEAARIRQARITKSKAAPIKVKKVDAPLPPVAPVDDEEVEFPDELDRLVVVKKLGGSTGAELVKDPLTGKQYVRKAGASPEHVRREVQADEVYRSMGVRVPAARLYETNKGPVKLSNFIEGKTLDQVMTGGKLDPRIASDIQDGFAADVLMGNRDVIGMNFDNILIDSRGRAWRIDNGASFDFRAQGAQKEYDDWPMEMWSMRDPKINRQTAAVFGDMDYDRLMARTNEVSRRATDSAHLLPTGVREPFLSRAERMRTISDTHDELRRDGWNAQYSDRFGFFTTKMDQDGVFNRFPNELFHPDPSQPGKNSWSTKEVYQVEDAEGVAFDHMRGSNSAVNDLDTWMTANGGRYKTVENYLSGQAGSSWSTEAQAFKYHIYQAQDNPPADRTFWGKPRQGPSEAKSYYDAAVGNSTLKYSDSMTMYHAFTFQAMKRIEFTNNDRGRGVCHIIRTEDEDLLKRNGVKKGELETQMARGAAESGSIFKSYSLYGNQVTEQDVPHSRILVAYFFSNSPGSSHGALAGDHENEFVFAANGIDFTWTRSHRAGR